MTPARTSPLLLLLLLGLAACKTTPDAPVVSPVAEADTTAPVALNDMALNDADAATAMLAPLGESGASGTVEFRRLGGATEIRYAIDGLSPGEHGFHLHQNADCAADSTGDPGTAAGGHFNPLTSPHGAPSAALTGRHAGDFGNITANAEGRAEGIVIDSVLTFEGPTKLLGHAVIVHAGRDDLETQPSGDSGARVACGVAGAAPAAAPARPPAPAPPAAR